MLPRQAVQQCLNLRVLRLQPGVLLRQAVHLLPQRCQLFLDILQPGHNLVSHYTSEAGIRNK